MTEDPLEALYINRLTRRDVLRGAAAGGIALAGGGVFAACGASGQDAADGNAGTIRAGGPLRVALTGGSAKDTLDVHNSTSDVDAARAFQLYETLALRNRDYELELILAESIEPARDDSVGEWIIRLKPDIVFHDGKPLTADDVIFTLQRILDPEDPKGYAAALSYVDAKRLKKLDELTVRVPLSSPNSGFVDDISQFANAIVPVGFDPQAPIGTGPYKFESFSPGRESVFSRNDEYWRTGQPTFDEVIIVDLGDDTARINALISGQVDAISNVPSSQVKTLESNPAVSLIVSETGNFQPITMRTDRPPFDDIRVRQAFKLIVDREEMVSQALNGQGRVANDIPGPFDPLYDDSIEQRSQDLEQAKSLLKAAGRSDLAVELVTAPAYAGMTEAAQVFAQQAKGAGVDVSVKKVTTDTFFGDEYLQRNLSQHYWFTRTILSQVAYEFLPESTWNESHWNNERFNELIAEARSGGTEEIREEALHEAQQIMWDDSGVIIHSFSHQVDAVRSDLVGFEASRPGIPLMNYNFRETGRTG